MGGGKDLLELAKAHYRNVKAEDTCDVDNVSLFDVFWEFPLLQQENEPLHAFCGVLAYWDTLMHVSIATPESVFTKGWEITFEKCKEEHKTERAREHFQQVLKSIKLKDVKDVVPSKRK